MLRTRCVVPWLATLVVFYGTALAQTPHASPRPAAGQVGRIGIGIIGPAGLPAELRIRLEDAAAAGLKASGAEVVSAVELSRARAGASLGSCSDTLCEQRLAQVTDTRYWLRGTCQVDTSTYRLHLELVDARSGAIVVARDDTCDICTEADAAETMNVAASALKAALGRAPAPRPIAAPPATPAAATPAGPPVTAATRASPPLDKRADERETWPPWRRVLPWVAFGGAAVAGAAGAYYLAIDGDGYDCRGMPSPGTCRLINDTTWQWGPLLAAGAVLATAGVVLVATGDRSPPGGVSARDTAAGEGGRARTRGASLSLAVTAGGVSVGGTF